MIQNSGKVYEKVDKDAIQEWLDSGEEIPWGTYYDRFEKELAKYIGTKHALFVNSGSSANLIAFAAMFIDRHLKPGDEIITLAASFPTTVSPIVQYGCVPVFVDIDIPTYQINIKQMKDALSEKTKGVFIAHTLGNPFNLNLVEEFCIKHNLFLIEDNADAFGSEYEGRKTGSFGHMSTTSFYPAHEMSTGGGGAVFTSDRQLYKTAMSLRNWGKSCFLAGTSIYTDKGPKNIEDIVSGDKVYSHNGVYQEVSVAFKKPVSELVCVDVKKHENITCTPDHEFYVLPLTKEPNQYYYGGIPLPKPEWVEAQNLKPSYYVLERLQEFASEPILKTSWTYQTYWKEKTEELEWSADLGRLCGYWLAEGNLSKADKCSNGVKEKGRKRNTTYFKYRADFSFNENETEYIEDVKELMFRFFGVGCSYTNRSKKANRKGLCLNFNTRKGYEFFQQHFGEISYNKSLPSYFLSLSKETLSGLVVGFWRGDGSYWKGSAPEERVRRACYNIGTTSKLLALQLRQIMLMFSINPSWGVRTPEQHHPSVVEGKKIEAKRDMYLISVYGENARNLALLLGESTDNITTDRHFYFTEDGKYAVHVVNSVTVLETKEPVLVYDLTVENDHSYHANGLAVHNCTCPPNKDNMCGKRFTQQHGDLPYGYDHKYVFSNFGYNLMSTNMQAALGLAQLSRMHKFTAARIRNFFYLWQRLIKSPLKDKMVLPMDQPNSEPSWFGFPLLLVPGVRNELSQFLNKNGVGTRNLFAGNLIRQPMFTENDVKYRVVGDLRNTEKVMNDLLWVGCWHGLTIEDMETIYRTLEKFYGL